MKKLNIIYLLLLVLCWGCDDFLEESSQNLVKPSNVNDLEQILFGDGYGDADGGIPYETSIFTDEIQCYVKDLVQYNQNESRKETYQKQKGMYTFNPNMFKEENFGYKDAFWGTYYRRILGCNIVLDHLDGILQTTTSEDEITKGNAIRGEALALRAWCYLHLVNMYGIAYNQGNPETDLAVPVRTSCQFEFAAPRNTVAEVYEQIEKDLLSAINLLEKNPILSTTFRIQAPAAKAMLARVYLYQERWDDAIEYSEEALAKKSTLLDFTSEIPVRAPESCSDFIHKIFGYKCYIHNWGDHTGHLRPYAAENYNVECLWTRQTSSTIELYNLGDGSGWGPYGLSDEFIAIFGDKISAADYNTIENRGDLRGVAYFYWYNTGTNHSINDEIRIYLNKGTVSGNTYKGIRTAELYLNLAEAYAQKYANGGTATDRDAAIKNLNILRQHRFAPTAWEEKGKVEAADFASAQELLEFCVAERQKELCGETNHRYCDLRRYGITVTHEDRLNGGTYTQNMGQFVLPIPQYILENDLTLKDNY